MIVGERTLPIRQCVHSAVRRFSRRVTNHNAATAPANRAMRGANNRPYPPAGADPWPAAGCAFAEGHELDETLCGAGVITTLLDPARLVLPGVPLLVPAAPVIPTGELALATSSSPGAKRSLGGPSDRCSVELLASSARRLAASAGDAERCASGFAEICS
jgi:hypothetical protein